MRKNPKKLQSHQPARLDRIKQPKLQRPDTEEMPLTWHSEPGRRRPLHHSALACPSQRRPLKHCESWRGWARWFPTRPLLPRLQMPSTAANTQHNVEDHPFVAKRPNDCGVLQLPVLGSLNAPFPPPLLVKGKKFLLSQLTFAAKSCRMLLFNSIGSFLPGNRFNFKFQLMNFLGKVKERDLVPKMFSKNLSFQGSHLFGERRLASKALIQKVSKTANATHHASSSFTSLSLVKFVFHGFTFLQEFTFQISVDWRFQKIEFLVKRRF